MQIPRRRNTRGLGLPVWIGLNLILDSSEFQREQKFKIVLVMDRMR